MSAAVEPVSLGDFRDDLIASLTISAGPVSVVNRTRATEIVDGLEAVVEQRAREGAKKVIVPALIASFSVTALAVIFTLRK